MACSTDRYVYTGLVRAEGGQGLLPPPCTVGTPGSLHCPHGKDNCMLSRCRDAGYAGWLHDMIRRWQYWAGKKVREWWELRTKLRILPTVRPAAGCDMTWQMGLLRGRRGPTWAEWAAEDAHTAPGTGARASARVTGKAGAPGKACTHAHRAHLVTSVHHATSAAAASASGSACADTRKGVRDHAGPAT